MVVEARLSRLLMRSHPDQAAQVLDELTGDIASQLILTVEVELAAPVIASMDPFRAAACLEACGAKRAAEILDALPVERSVVLLRNIGTDSRQAILELMGSPERERLRRRLGDAEGTAGSLMDSNVVTFPEDALVGEALRRLRGRARGLEHYLYLTDRNHRLVGAVALPELLRAAPRRRLSEIAFRDVARLRVRDDSATVLAHPGWQTRYALPVVDRGDLLVGELRYATLRRLESVRETDGRPDLLLLVTTLTGAWAGLVALILDGFGGALTAARSAADIQERSR